MPNYWVVGAAIWGEHDEGHEPQDHIWVPQGIWTVYYGQDDQFHKKALLIERGDRIAIKRLKGGGQTEIDILHLGIVKGVIDVAAENQSVFTVDWVAQNLNRTVPMEGVGGIVRINGPFEADNPRIREIFFL